jgi:hypothetical protein
LSPLQKQDNSPADEDDVVRRIREDDLVHFLEDNKGDLEIKRFLFFLYARDFISQKPKEECVRAILTILQPGEALERLKKIVEVSRDGEIEFSNRS